MKNIKEIIITTFTVIILLAFLVHEPLLMPMGVQMFLIATVCVLYLGLVAFFFKENPRDERESIHHFEAGRFSFLVGSFFLLFGMAIGVLKHDVNPFLPITLIAMILSKIFYRYHAEKVK